MKSHTVPRKLLEQFAYPDPKTGSPRLWRYEKDRAPFPKATPKTATTSDGHFSDPDDAAKEEQLEIRLAQKFEQPVNDFLFKTASSELSLTNEQRRQLAFYVTLLFFRSTARRRASSHLQQVTRNAYDQFLRNESQVLTVAAKWNLELYFSGRLRSGLVTSADVKVAARDLLQKHLTEMSAQSSYVAIIGKMMSECDEKLSLGQWDCIRTTLDNPFIISDAPVVTW